MGDGTTSGLFEIGEVTFSILFLLIIGTGIIFVSNPDFIKTKLSASESSYVASQVSGTNIVVEIQYDETQIKEEKKKIITQVSDSEPQSSEYYGEKIQIKQEGDLITFKG